MNTRDILNDFTPSVTLSLKYYDVSYHLSDDIAVALSCSSRGIYYAEIQGEREREGETKREDRFLPRFAYDFTCALLTRDYATAAGERGVAGVGAGGGGGGGRGAGAALVPVAQPHYLRSSLRRLGN